MKNKIKKFVDDHKVALAYIAGSTIAATASIMTARYVVRSSEIVKIETLNESETGKMAGYVATRKNGIEDYYQVPLDV